MSTLTYLTSLVQQAISRLNNYEANAKKVDELPHQTTLEPTSKLPVSRGGISEHVTVQQIISSIQNSNYNQLLAVGTISVSGTDITVPSGVSGQINGLLYGTSADTILSITLCATGFSRKDIIVLTTANTVVVISGDETDGAIVLAPPVPTDAVYITEFDVNDTTIGEPIDPTLGTQFKKKSESAAYNDPTLSGSNAVIALQPNGQSVYAFSNAELVSIDGFGLDLITGNPSAEVPYPGKDILIYNNKAGNLTLKHDGSGTADVKFLLEGSVDLVIPAGGKVWLKYGPSYCEIIFKSWSDVDLSSKADLVGGKVPASQLPSYVDDVIEGYFNGTDFYTDALFTDLITPESGKIYVDLSTNLQYRWSGSIYVSFSAKEKVIFYNRSTWTFPNVASAPFPLISSTNFELATANLNSGTDDALTALNNISVIFMPIGIAPFGMKLKRVILEGRQSFGSWQGFNLRCVVGSNRTIQINGGAYSHLDSQVVEDFTHSLATPVGTSIMFVNHSVTSPIVVPQNHGVILMMSYSRTGIAISPIISTYLEFERE